MSAAKRRCRDCSHVQMCSIAPQFKLAWDRTFQHFDERTGEDALLAKLHELIADHCKHFEKATKAQKVLSINTAGRPR